MRRIKGAFIFLLFFSLVRFQPLVCLRSSDKNNPGMKISKTPVVTIDSLHGSNYGRERGKLAAKGSSSVPKTYQVHPLEFLSRAPVDSLSMLKGIGPVLARRIIRARSGKGPFTSWKDLLNVRGIGLGKVLELRRQAGEED